MNKLVEYIASAVRYATRETGLRDWDGFIVLVSEIEIDGKDQVLGMPVYVVPICGFSYTFVLSYPWDIDDIRLKAMRSILEYQQLYNIDAIGGER